jgi:hypothetical protein
MTSAYLRGTTKTTSFSVRRYISAVTLSYDGCWSRLYIICIAYNFKRQTSYQDFLDRGLLLTRKLLNQGFLLVKLKSSLRRIYGPHHDLVDRYGISVSQMTTDADLRSGRRLETGRRSESIWIYHIYDQQIILVINEDLICVKAILNN